MYKVIFVHFFVDRQTSFIAKPFELSAFGFHEPKDTQRDGPWVGTWRPHAPRLPISALYGNPGPKYKLPPLTGANKHDPTKPKAQMFSFGQRFWCKSTDCSPGPKYLILPNIMRHGHSCAPAFSLHGRPEERPKFKTPGPGQYYPENSGKATFPSAPAYSLTGRHELDSNNGVPGPGTYKLPPIIGSKAVTRASAPRYTMASRLETGTIYEGLHKTPGPAVYGAVDPYISRRKPPQFSMRGRLPPLNCTKTPGPGAHHPEHRRSAVKPRKGNLQQGPPPPPTPVSTAVLDLAGSSDSSNPPPSPGLPFLGWRREAVA
ncbi:ciliary microtubule associated protein 1B-like [Cololabis saira]|uniref:ciliary microtubule associated protein 1B-like n=1 Tax=Cololabis saira TaxID=129043 RepID=UPI002AD22C15|nr:ciliary microtubule associated protein 1B-like [Cololabis saira]